MPAGFHDIDHVRFKSLLLSPSKVLTPEPNTLVVRIPSLKTVFPIAKRHDTIGEPTPADGILDRLVPRSFLIEMQGESMRKQRAKTAVPAAS